MKRKYTPEGVQYEYANTVIRIPKANPVLQVRLAKKTANRSKD